MATDTTTTPKPATPKLGVMDFADAGVNLAQSLLNPDASSASKGSGIGGGIGTAAGAIFGGPLGAQIGGQLGSMVGGLIGGKSDKDKAVGRMRDVMNKKYNALDVAYNANPYGEGSSFYAEDGLVVPDGNGPVQVNIEKGELQVDPATLEVLGDFKTRRYKPHARDKANENPGNFITMDPSHVIIPKKKADAFKNGDRISRRSIIAQIMQDQEANGIDTNDSVAYAEKGLVGDPYSWMTGVDKSQIKAHQNYLIGKGADIKADGIYGPKTAAATKAYGLMPQLGITPDDQPIDPGIDYNFGIPNIANMDRHNIAAQPTIESATNFDIKSPTSITNTTPTIGINDVTPGTRPDRLKKGFPKVNINPVKAARIGQALSSTLGLGMALQNDPFLQYNENNQYDSAKASIQQMPVDENMEAVKAANARTNAAYIQQMRNVNSPSTRAEVYDMIGKNNANLEGVLADSANRRVQRIGQKLGMLADLDQKQGMDRENARERFATASSQDRAARQGMIQSAASEMSGNFAKSVMDDERIKAVNSMLRFNKITPGADSPVGVDSDALNAAIAMLGTFAGSGMLPQPAKGKATVTTKTSQNKDRRGMASGSNITQSVTTKE